MNAYHEHSPITMSRAEPRYANRKGEQSRAHKRYCQGLRILRRAKDHLRAQHGPKKNRGIKPGNEY